MKTRVYVSVLLFACFLFMARGAGVASHAGDKDASGSVRVAEQTPAAAKSSDVSPILAATPPLGWNSWDGYVRPSRRSSEGQRRLVRGTSETFLLEYVVIDMEWFVTNPTPEGNSKNSLYALDANGRTFPQKSVFPLPLEEKASAHRRLHPFAWPEVRYPFLRGIPKRGCIERPIAGSSYHASDAADTGETCPWNPDNFGADATKPAAQAYYDSIASLYASWGVDLIKVDCISSRPYRGEEIRMLSAALAKTAAPSC